MFRLGPCSLLPFPTRNIPVGLGRYPDQSAVAFWIWLAGCEPNTLSEQNQAAIWNSQNPGPRVLCMVIRDDLFRGLSETRNRVSGTECEPPTRVLHCSPVTDMLSRFVVDDKGVTMKSYTLLKMIG